MLGVGLSARVRRAISVCGATAVLVAVPLATAGPAAAADQTIVLTYRIPSAATCTVEQYTTGVSVDPGPGVSALPFGFTTPDHLPVLGPATIEGTCGGGNGQGTVTIVNQAPGSTWKFRFRLVVNLPNGGTTYAWVGSRVNSYDTAPWYSFSDTPQLAEVSAGRPGTITGHHDGFAPVAGRVLVVDADGRVVRDEPAGPDFTLNGVPTGTFRVLYATADQPAGSPTAVSSFWRNRTEDAGVPEANVTVADGQQLDLGTQAVVPGATVTGSYVLRAGSPVTAGTKLVAYGDGNGKAYRWATLGSDGSFRFTGLSTGRYHVATSTPTLLSPFGPEDGRDLFTMSVVSGQSTNVGKVGSIGFRDISPSTTPFATQVEWMRRTGITTGYADGTFRPNVVVTRDQLAAFLYRLSGSPAFTPPARSPFVDVPTNHPFYEEIAWLAARGISTGWANPDGTKSFRPATAVSREATAAFLCRLGGKGVQATSSPALFTDIATSPFVKQINWMATTGVSTGWPDGTFRPLAYTQRDVMAAFLYRYAHL